MNIFKRDLLIYFKTGTSVINPVLLFLLIITIYSIALTNDIVKLAPIIIWIAVILAILLNLDNLFKNDYKQGFFEQLFLSNKNINFLLFEKILALWVVSTLPITLIVPFIGMMFNISFQGILAINITLLIASFILCSLGSMCTAITIQLDNSSMLLAIIILPLYIPIVILGVGASLNAIAGLPYIGQIKILLAILLNCVIFIPILIAKILRINLN